MRGLLRQIKKPQPIQGLHRLIRPLFVKAGFHWELRRSGELKIGLWRKTLGRRSNSPSHIPRRLVWVPGFGDTSLSWIQVVAMLSPVLKKAGYDELILMDFPGFNGFLAGEKSFHSMDLLIAAANDVFDSLAPETMIGHSLGGWLVSRYAVECGQGKRPHIRKRQGYGGPESILLISPSGVYGENEKFREEFEALFRNLVRGGGFDVMRPHLFAKEPFWFKWMRSEFDRFASDEGVGQFTESVREDHLVQDHLSAVQARTWLIWGEQDTLIPSALAPAWLKRLKGASVPPCAVYLKGVGHSPQIEAPMTTAAVLGQILLGRKPHLRGSRWWRVEEAEL